MRPEHSTVEVVSGLFAFIFVVVFVGAGVYWLGSQFDTVAPWVWTSLAGGGGYLLSTWIERGRAHERLLADQKREQYFELLDLTNESFGGALPDESTIKELRRWSLRLMLVGSDEVVTNWNAARTSAGASSSQDEPESEQASIEALRLWGKLLLSMRKDCGHFRTRLGVPEVLGAIIDDYEKHRAALESD